MKKKQTKKWKRVVKRIVLLTVVLALIGGGVWYAYGQLVSSYTTTYDGYTATKGSISNALSFSGSFALIDSAAYTASTSATVKNVYVAAGDQVKDGDKLIRLSGGEVIKAEFDGRVNTVSVEEGDEVAAGANLVQVADFNHMSVSIRVDEYDIADVYVGQALSVTATATEKEFESTIKSINYISASGGSVAYYSALAEVDVDEGIYPGMQATVTITQEEANDVVILKADALSFDSDNSAFVYVQAEDGTMTEQYVTVGVSNGNYVEIAEGISEGDTVYAVAEVEESASGISGLLSGLFGSQQISGGGMKGGNRGDFDMSNMPSFDSGSMPTGGGGGGMPGGGQ